MSINLRAVVLLILPALLGMRDPFAPVDDPCRGKQLHLWQYGGLVDARPRTIGFLRDEAGKWRRAELGMSLYEHWRISQVTADRLTVDSAEGCEPRQWHLIRGGLQNDKKDRPAGAADSTTADGRQQKRVAGRG